MPRLASRINRFAAIILATSFLVHSEGIAQSSKNADEFSSQQFLSEQGIGFGRAVAIGEGEILVTEDRSSAEPGAVFVYRTTIEGEWEQSQKLNASNKVAGDGFGRAISLSPSGNRFVVTSEAAPSAWVFVRDEGGSWTEEAILTASDSAMGFGRSVVALDSVVVVGAPGRDNGTGAVYVFERDSASGSWIETDLIDGFESSSTAGTGVSFAGDQLLVGAPRANGFAGHVYVYERTGTDFEPVDSLSGDPLDPAGTFGWSVSGSADHIVVGDDGGNGNQGRVFVYKRDELLQTWNEQERIDSPDLSSTGRFGYSVAISDTSIIIGARAGQTSEGASGTAYVFVESSSEKWEMENLLIGSEREHNDLFGYSVAIRGDVSVVGALLDDNALGGAFVYSRDQSLWGESAYLFQTAGIDDITGTRVPCENGFADGYPCSDVDLISFVSTSTLGGGRGAGVNDIWGWTDATTGNEYAVVGRTDGTSFVDVSDPLNPIVIGSLPTNTTSSSWRDVKVFSDHAFVVSEASNHGMQVFDLKRLRSAVDLPMIFDADTVYTGFGRAHNVVISEESGFAFGVGAQSATCSAGLHMVDISAPLEPTYAGCFQDLATGRSNNGYTHDAHCVVYDGPDTEHADKEICIGANETHISVADVTNKVSPIVISNATYPNARYVHQGWLSEDHRYFYQNDELDESNGVVPTTTTFIWDMIDLDDPQLVGTHVNTTASIDHNLYVVGSKMYQSNYTSGLRIFDITNPIVPVEEAFFDVFPASDDANFSGSWSNYPFFESGTIIVTSRELGLFVVARSSSSIAVDEEPGIALPGVSGFYPNPFVDSGTIRLHADARQSVSIRVFDLLGRLQRSIDDVTAEQGSTELSIDLSNLSAGTYVVKVDGASVKGSVVVVKAK